MCLQLWQGVKRRLSIYGKATNRGRLGTKCCTEYLEKAAENCIMMIIVNFLSPPNIMSGPGSSVGIATELRTGRSGNRIPVERDFSPVQTGPGTHPASCTVGTGSFPRVKYGQGVLLTTHPLLVPWSWKSRAIPLPTLWATTGPVTGTLYLFYLILWRW